MWFTCWLVDYCRLPRLVWHLFLEHCWFAVVADWRSCTFGCWTIYRHTLDGYAFDVTRFPDSRTAGLVKLVQAHLRTHRA